MMKKLFVLGVASTLAIALFGCDDDNDNNGKKGGVIDDAATLFQMSSECTACVQKSCKSEISACDSHAECGKYYACAVRCAESDEDDSCCSQCRIDLIGQEKFEQWEPLCDDECQGEGDDCYDVCFADKSEEFRRAWVILECLETKCLDACMGGDNDDDDSQ